MLVFKEGFKLDLQPNIYKIFRKFQITKFKKSCPILYISKAFKNSLKWFFQDTFIASFMSEEPSPKLIYKTNTKSIIWMQFGNPTGGANSNVFQKNNYHFCIWFWLKWLLHRSKDNFIIYNFILYVIFWFRFYPC